MAHDPERGPRWPDAEGFAPYIVHAMRLVTEFLPDDAALAASLHLRRPEDATRLRADPQELNCIQRMRLANLLAARSTETTNARAAADIAAHVGRQAEWLITTEIARVSQRADDDGVSEAERNHRLYAAWLEIGGEDDAAAAFAMMRRFVRRDPGDDN